MENKRDVEIMGIVNLTDDSFFSGSRCADVDSALSAISTMLDEGADIIDIGACSTRPGSIPVGEDKEWIRLEPVLSELTMTFPGIRISIDTCSSSVVRNAYDTIGTFIVNDISSGEEDPAMLGVVGKLRLPYVAMHKRGTPLDMNYHTDYKDVTSELIGYFKNFAIRAQEAGIQEWILDPGFGFAKTVEQNYALLKNLRRISAGRKTLVGVSRKSMIYKLLGITPEESLCATQAVHMAALANGADILRVHDVKEARQTVDIYRMLTE